ncbi:MAG: 3-phosphoglycerate dehydrogenase, partial [Clostridia bacterium]|nr:3-phosphoglycerate dehydrogenase [Clostridia bacterium]
MKNVLLMNSIADSGIEQFDYTLYHLSTDEEDPDLILVSSASLHDREVNPSLKAIGRAGAGVNNIPVEELAEKGVVVFNTPGANA